MYYIRILRSPKIISRVPCNDRKKNSKSPSNHKNSPFISTKITITSDLGDIFLDQDLTLLATLLGPDLQSIITQTYHSWKGTDGMRVLELKVLLPLSIPLIQRAKMKVSSSSNMNKKTEKLNLKLWIHPADSHVSIETFATLLQPNKSVIRVLPVGSLFIPFDDCQHDSKDDFYTLMERTFIIEDGRKLHIFEEIGESISRHIWDAGLVLSACIASSIDSKPEVDSVIDLANPSHAHTYSSITSISTCLPTLTALFRTIKKTCPSQPPFQILELGAGCGIVSLTLFSCLFTTTEKNSYHSSAHLALTDLPIAIPILNTNITASCHSSSFDLHQSGIIRHMVLDWTEALPSSIANNSWDIVLVADCTYNADIIPSLVTTLGRIKDKNGRENKNSQKGQQLTTKVVVALKERHSSESIFFSLMKLSHWVLIEECAITLPKTMSQEEIKIFLFT